MLDNPLDTGDSVTNKVIRLVDFLTKVALLRSRLIRDIQEYDKIFWLSSIPHQRGCYTQAWGRDEEHEQDEWLEVQNQPEPKLPAVPSQCQKWVILSTLRIKNNLPELLTEINEQIQNSSWKEGSDEPQFITQSLYLADYPIVSKSWDQYVEKEWLPWMEVHNAWEEVHKVYSALFSIHQELIRLGEEYELVLGLGLLKWKTPTGQYVRRHLIVADVLLEFEARLGKFTVRPHTDGAKLRPELDMLDTEEQPCRAEETAKNALGVAGDDPWDKGCIEGTLKALVHSINPHGNYDESLVPNNIQGEKEPLVEYAPALILRKRSTKGLTDTLRKIKEQIQDGETIPKEFADLAEITSTDEPERQLRLNNTSSLFDGEVFFPKPSNDEQRRIVDKLRTANGVLVQGPPGTGKSHTIANLICHLLATGQRILITAKTPRALQVLEGLMPVELRPLCISLLGSGHEERSSLESSVGGILRKHDEWDEERGRSDLRGYEKSLQILREEKARVDRRIQKIRESETYSNSIADGAYRGTAARIAEAVNRDRPNYNWFNDSVKSEQTCPITTEDLVGVLEALRFFTPEIRSELELTYPRSIPSSEFFESLVIKESSAIEEEKNESIGADLNLAARLTRNPIQAIENVISNFTTFRDYHKRFFSTQYSWMNDAIREILGGYSSLWHELLKVTRQALSSLEQHLVIIDEVHVDIPDSIDIRLLYEHSLQLEDYFNKKGGTLGLLFPNIPAKANKRIIKAVRIGGKPCTNAKDFSTLASILHFRIELEKAWNYWKGRSEKIQGPHSLQMIALKSLRDSLADALELEIIINKCRVAIKPCSAIIEPIWSDGTQIERIITSSRLALAHIRRQQITEDIQRVESPLLRLMTQGDVHPVVTDLVNAIRNRDVKNYAQGTARVHELNKRSMQLENSDRYLSNLRQLLPSFTTILENTYSEPYWVNRLHRIGDAWRWAQAEYWTKHYIKQEDVSDLSMRAKQIEEEINGNLAKLASLHAWSHCFSSDSKRIIKDQDRRHMEAWKQSMRRLGLGTGRHALRHRREAQGHLNACRESVPAWVMPLHRIWDTVSPSPEIFDVIIVDEASQCGIESLPLFYLGKKILIVGDDKQISPDAVGLPRDSVHRLMEEFLYDFSFKSSFDIESSLFDHGKLRYGTQRITLREHFRCMPEIIRFSNDLCYSDTPLIPLRQYGPHRLPPLEHVFVEKGYREGTDNRTINRPEAEAIVNMITELCSDKRYIGKSMGVVVLQGEAQATVIENLLLERLGSKEIDQRRLVCGNPYSFQGDERDIIFLSLVAASNKRIGPYTKAADERRFNVAASRARDRMILFHSVTSDDLSAVCLRRRLLDYFESTKPKQVAGIEVAELERRAAQDNRVVIKPPSPFDSWFEVDVALELLRKDYNIIPQYELAGKRIDLVVEGGQARLAIECDGDFWHGVDRFEADMQRQRILERCGWQFFRIRESAFYYNKETALAGLWGILSDREIHPLSQPGTLPDDNNIIIKDPDDVSEIISNTPILHGEDISGEDIGGEDVDTKQVEPKHDTESPDIPKKNAAQLGRRPVDISDNDILKAIFLVLSTCPNNSCTLDSLTTRVLKELKFITRGNPRQEFEKRVMRCVVMLEKRNNIEKYRAKNLRIRLKNKPEIQGDFFS